MVDGPVEFVNRVELSGRVGRIGEEKVLPSGDRVRAWQVIVPRPPGSRSARPARNRPDVIDVSCWTPATRRALSRLAEGQQVVVEGALRRRFYSGSGGLGSRYEVEVLTLRRL